MLQKYCVCHEKVEPRHTNSCNCHAKWPLQSNISVMRNLQPFHRGTAWCKFCEAQLPKASRRCQFLTISTSESLWRHSVVQILSTSWAADPPHHLAFRSWLCEPAKPRNCGKTSRFSQLLPAKSPHGAHLCCKTSMLSSIDASRTGGNFQYSRKLDS